LLPANGWPAAQASQLLAAQQQCCPASNSKKKPGWIAPRPAGLRLTSTRQLAMSAAA